MKILSFLRVCLVLLSLFATTAHAQTAPPANESSTNAKAVADLYEQPEAHHQAERFKEAIEAYQAILKLQPGHLGARLDLGAALAQSGKYAEAVEVLRARFIPG